MSINSESCRLLYSQDTKLQGMTVTSMFKTLNQPMRFAALLFFAMICFVVARIVITFVNPESIWEVSAPQQNSAINAASAVQNFSFNTDPFGSKSVTTDNVEDVIIGGDVPETTLNLEMTGRTTGETGSAILRTADNKEAVYMIGDEVIDDVFLKAVNKDFVVLSVNGDLQRLTFEVKESGELSPNNTPISNAATPPNLKRQATKAGITQDAISVFENINFRRSLKDGQLQGFAINPKKAGVDLSVLGLRKGDIVTQIDGKDITSGRVDFLSLFQESARKENIDVTVLRNGQSRIIRLGAN